MTKKQPADVYYESLLGFAKILAEETGGRLEMNAFLGAIATFTGKTIGTVPGRELRESLCVKVDREIVASMKREAKRVPGGSAELRKSP